MDNLELRRIGDSVVVTIPVDVLDRYGLKEGDSLRVGREADGIKLTPETKRDRQLRIGRQVMKDNHDALALLAK